MRIRLNRSIAVMLLCVAMIVASAYYSSILRIEGFGLMSVITGEGNATPQDAEVTGESGRFDTNGVFRIRNVTANECISIDSKPIYTSSCDPAATLQNMKLFADSGNYKINNLAVDKCVYHNSAGKLGIDGCDNLHTDQAWQINQGPDDTTRLINVQSGMCLTTNKSSPMTMETCDENNQAQRYHLDKQAL